jgi:hypothetical protein
MHTPSIAADSLAVVVLSCAAITLLMIRLRRSGRTIFDGGILLALGLSIASALPVLSRLPWAEFANGMTGQAVAAIQFLEVAYVILTL